MVRISDDPRDRAEIADALELRAPVAASVLNRQIVLKDGNRFSSPPKSPRRGRSANSGTRRAGLARVRGPVGSE